MTYQHFFQARDGQWTCGHAHKTVVPAIRCMNQRRNKVNFWSIMSNRKPGSDVGRIVVVEVEDDHEKEVQWIVPPEDSNP
jgi:hypothetical protein